jgi:hypothetical protein
MVEGKVFSDSTQNPIEGATVEMVGKNEKTKTNKDGYFKVEKIVGFCFDPIIRITKNNYKPFEIKFKNLDDSKIYEIKSKSDFITYDKPFYPDSTNKNTFVTGTWINQYSEHFDFNADTNLFYLDTISLNKEIQKAQTNFKKAMLYKNH